MAPHILSHELGQNLKLERVRMSDKSNLLEVNSKGMVPALVLENGSVFTEVAVILQVLCDHTNNTLLMGGKHGSESRYRVQEWLNYIASELHKAFVPFFKFKKELSSEAREVFMGDYKRKLRWLNGQLKDRETLADDFSCADIYAFVVINWSNFIGVDLDEYAHLSKWYTKTAARESVRKTQKLEQAAA